MTFERLIKSISKIEKFDLPGESSQFKMVPPFRQELLRRQGNNIKNAKQSAVLALLYPNYNLPYIVLILRKTYKGVHSAQIGFPGGKVEKEDASLMHTALREAEEEVGILPEKVSIIKPLSRVYIPPSNFYVHPFLAFTKETPNFIKQDDEVEMIVEVKLENLLDNDLMISQTVSTSYKVDVEVPAFKLNNHIVWGATAMMLSEIKDLLKATL